MIKKRAGGLPRATAAAPPREADIKRLLAAALAADPAHADATVVTELRCGQGRRRADLVAVGRHLAAFEIKSAADRLVRLPGQVDLFARAFESVTVVCARRHRDNVLRLLADRDRVGVWVVESDGRFTVVRGAVVAPLPVQEWLNHLTAVEVGRFLRAAGERCTGRRRALEARAKACAPEALRAHAMAYLANTHPRREAFKREQEKKVAEARRLRNERRRAARARRRCLPG